MMSRKRELKVLIKFTKRDGQETTFYATAPHDWHGMSSIRRLAWAQHTARHHHNGATGATILDEGWGR